jgi:uncharacterized protein (DUF1015 family)
MTAWCGCPDARNSLPRASRWYADSSPIGSRILTPIVYTDGVPIVAPFDGLVYDPAVVGSIAAATAPPYDVILADELAHFRSSSAFSITNVDLTEDVHGADRDYQYTKAGVVLRRWREQGALVHVGTPAVYPYEMRFTFQGVERRIRGLILEVGLEEWGGGVVPHEETMPGPVEDRLAILRTTRTNVSPIYAVVDGPCPPQREILEAAGARAPTFEVEDERGVLHRLWVETDAEGLADWYEDRTLLIADGHHRYQTALTFQREMREAQGPGPWDAVMMLLVDAATEDPPVLPIHRLVRAAPRPDLPGHLVRDLGEVLASLTDDDLRFGAAWAEDGELYHLVGRLEGDPPTVDALHREVLDRLEGLRDLRFVPDAVVAEEAVRSGEADLAFFLPPARVSNVERVIAAGGRLPQKSTYFWPKPRTGLVLRPLE